MADWGTLATLPRLSRYINTQGICAFVGPTQWWQIHSAVTFCQTGSDNAAQRISWILPASIPRNPRKSDTDQFWATRSVHCIFVGGLNIVTVELLWARFQRRPDMWIQVLKLSTDFPRTPISRVLVSGDSHLPPDGSSCGSFAKARVPTMWEIGSHATQYSAHCLQECFNRNYES